MFLAQQKKDMVSKVFFEKPTPSYPVSSIGTPQNKALWVLDTDAGELLFKKKKK